MDRVKTNTAIITAAGSGMRMGGEIKKQFRLLNGIPILIRTLKPFYLSEHIDNIIVTAPEEDLEYCCELIEAHYLNEDKPLLVVPGGAQRQDSILGALEHCPPDTGLVFIHDAVRPFVSTDFLDELRKMALRYKAVVPASRLKNTIKQVSGEYIEKTLVRNRLIQVYTPQVFDYRLLVESYEKAYEDGFVSTDDSALVEYYGTKVSYLLTGDINIKITDEWDLTIAQLILEKAILG